MTTSSSLATSLELQKLSVRDLRCHRALELELQPGVNLISGENGCGKTTLLEAAFIMAQGRSFRQARDPELVHWDCEKYAIHGRWRRFGPFLVDVKGSKGKTEVRLQGKVVQRRKDLIEHLPVIADAPQGSRLVDGAPNERRRWLDAVLISCRESIRNQYQRYLRSVMQRNRILRRSIHSQELEAWEQQVVSYGLQIQQSRETLIAQFNQALEAEESITEARLILEMNPAAGMDQRAWLERLKSGREDDARMGGMRSGPHRDQLRIIYRGRDIRSIGSRGQQRLAAVALRLAESEVRVQHRQLVPVLLLDDCLEALDSIRQERLLDRLASYPGQVLLTAPNNVKISAGMGLSVQHLQATENGSHAEKRPVEMEEAA